MMRSNQTAPFIPQISASITRETNTYRVLSGGVFCGIACLSNEEREQLESAGQQVELTNDSSQLVNRVLVFQYEWLRGEQISYGYWYGPEAENLENEWRENLSNESNVLLNFECIYDSDEDWM